MRLVGKRRNCAVNSQDGNERQKECHHPNGAVALQFIEKMLHVFQVVYENATRSAITRSSCGRVLHNGLCNIKGKKNPATRTGFYDDRSNYWTNTFRVDTRAPSWKRTK
jgi:hypothetical protein